MLAELKIHLDKRNLILLIWHWSSDLQIWYISNLSWTNFNSYPKALWRLNKNFWRLSQFHLDPLVLYANLTSNPRKVITIAIIQRNMSVVNVVNSRIRTRKYLVKDSNISIIWFTFLPMLMLKIWKILRFSNSEKMYNLIWMQKSIRTVVMVAMGVEIHLLLRVTVLMEWDIFVWLASLDLCNLVDIMIIAIVVLRLLWMKVMRNIMLLSIHI